MQRSAFAFGGLAGAGLVAVVVLALGGRDPGPQVSAGGHPSGLPGAGGTDDSEVAVLRAEIAALREELTRLRQPGSRERVTVTPEQPGEIDGENLTESALTLGGTTESEFDRLLAELREVFETGVLEERFRSDPDSLRGFLLETWYAVGPPERALALLREHPGDDFGAQYARWIAYELLEQGNTALATQAFTLALEGSPEDLSLVAEAAGSDPEATLLALERIAAERGEEFDLRSQRAVALLHAGRRDEALQLFDAMASEGMVPDMAWELLLDTDPAAAAERLRTAMEAGPHDDSMQIRLARSLEAMGDPTAARTEVLGLLGRNPRNLEALQHLGELDTTAAVQWIEGQMATGHGDHLWGEYGRNLESTGRSHDALAAYWEAFDRSPDWEWSGHLLGIDPLGSGPRLIASGESRQDDELLGDVADAYWSAGRRSEAERLWRRALQIDPSDSEWSGKVQAVASGRDPF